jgi:hypothetical protein
LENQNGPGNSNRRGPGLRIFSSVPQKTKERAKIGQYHEIQNRGKKQKEQNHRRLEGEGDSAGERGPELVHPIIEDRIEKLAEKQEKAQNKVVYEGKLFFYGRYDKSALTGIRFLHEDSILLSRKGKKY